MNEKVRGGIFVFLGACSFGVLSTIVKIAYRNGYTLGEVAGTQAFLGMILLWSVYFMLSFRKKNNEKVTGETSIIRKTPLWHLLVSGLSTGSVSLLYYQCVSLVPASVAIILLMQYLWISILLEAILFRKRPGTVRLVSVAVILAGTCLAGGLFGDYSGIQLKGVVFGLLAALAYAIFILVNGRVGNDRPPLQKSALMITGACFLIFIIFPPSFLFDGTLFSGLLRWGFPLALLGTVIPPLFFAIGMPYSGVTLGAILSTVELPVAVLSSRLVLHEDVDIIRWTGVALILAAIIVSNLKKE